MARKRKATTQAVDEEEEYQVHSEDEETAGGGREHEENYSAEDSGTAMATNGPVMVRLNKGGADSVLFRISPKFFSGVVEALNIKQKKDVVDKGKRREQ